MHHSLRLIAALALLLPLAAQAATRVDERAPAGCRRAHGNEQHRRQGHRARLGPQRRALTGTMADGLQLKQDKSANRVRWEVEYPRGRSNGGATLELRVPRSVEVQLGTVSADIDVADVDRATAAGQYGQRQHYGGRAQWRDDVEHGQWRDPSQLQTPRLDAAHGQWPDRRPAAVFRARWRRRRCLAGSASTPAGSSGWR